MHKYFTERLWQTRVSPKCSTASSVMITYSCLVVYFCRFSLVYRAGQAVTALCCSISRPSEVLVGLPDHSVLCVDLGTCVPLSLN